MGGRLRSGCRRGQGDSWLRQVVGCEYSLSHPGENWRGHLRSLTTIFNEHHNHNRLFCILGKAGEPGMRFQVTAHLGSASFTAYSETFYGSFPAAALGYHAGHHAAHDLGCLRLHKPSNRRSFWLVSGRSCGRRINFIHQVWEREIAIVHHRQYHHPHIERRSKQLALANGSGSSQQVIFC